MTQILVILILDYCIAVISYVIVSYVIAVCGVSYPCFDYRIVCYVIVVLNISCPCLCYRIVAYCSLWYRVSYRSRISYP
jgi:hypothetical protein